MQGVLNRNTGIRIAAGLALLLLAVIGLTSPVVGQMLVLALLAGSLFELARIELDAKLVRKEPGPIGLLVGTTVFGLVTMYLLLSQEGGVEMLIVILTSVGSVDTFSYFGGKLLGGKFFHTRPFPVLSKNKTYEGLICGVLFGWAGFAVSWGIVGDTASLVLSGGVEWWFGALLPVIAVAGDIHASMVKRAAGKDDFGALIPGHGGILDRIDGLVAVATVLGLILFF